MVKKKAKKKMKKSNSRKKKPVSLKKKTVKAKKKKIFKKKVKATKKKAPQEGVFIGKITHYFPHVNAAVITIKKSGLKLGDQILIKGHTTRFYEQITSMQIDRNSITEAKKGDEIGLLVKERVRANDEVYRISK